MGTGRRMFLLILSRIICFIALTLRSTKEALRRLRVDGQSANDHDLVTQCYMSADFREGMEAFLSKRKPTWTGT